MSPDLYNFHSHTQFCDGHAPMEVMARAAAEAGMAVWGFSPHSPICVPSPCNMSRESVKDYLFETDRLRSLYDGKMEINAGMEVDFLSRDFGPHIDYFQNLPLDYRIGSIHFVPNQDGIPIDCDGSAERFARNLKDGFSNDLRYVVEKFFEQELTMIELGGFHILGHFDKIATNASTMDPDIESQGWYESLIRDVARHAAWKGLSLEINTKAFDTKRRFFPSPRWWEIVAEAYGAGRLADLLSPVPSFRNTILVNSDAHYPDKINAGRDTAFKALRAGA